MNWLPWLWAVAVALAVAVLGASRVASRGHWPHDPAFDDPPTLLDGWHGRASP